MVFRVPICVRRQSLQQARAERDRLAKKRKKESQRLRKAHAGAMSALPELQALLVVPLHWRQQLNMT